MKRFIRIPYGVYEHLHTLTYNQLVLMLLICKNEDSEQTVINKYYHRHKIRYLNDLDAMTEVGKHIKELRVLNNHIESKKFKRDKDTIPLYYKMKLTTFNHIINDKNITKTNLLIILHLIKLYSNTYVRKHTIKIKDFLFEATNKPFTYRYKEFLVETLNIVKKWEYEDGSMFIKDFKIAGKNCIISLDIKKKCCYKFV
jgi:hypothetical protein